jgi:hypothetical protein
MGSWFYDTTDPAPITFLGRMRSRGNTLGMAELYLFFAEPEGLWINMAEQL